MLYPELKELLGYQKKINKLRLNTKNDTKQQYSGGITSIFRGQGLEFDSVRHYMYGDDVRHIDWKVTARTGKSHIKTYQKESLRNVGLIIDCNKYMRFGTRGTFKSVQAARVLSILAFAAVFNNDKVNAMLFGEVEDNLKLIKSGNKLSVYNIFDKLCDKTEYNYNEISLSSALNNYNRYKLNNDLVFVISDFLSIDKAFEKELYNLARKSEVVLISVNDPADYNIEDVGQLVFINNGDKFIVNSMDKIAVEKYQQLWQSNRQALMQAVGITKSKLIEINTKDEPLDILFKKMNRINKVCHAS